MKPFIFVMLALSTLYLSNCTDDSKVQNQGWPNAVIDSIAFDGYLEQLASDEFQGRKPFTEGETKTIAYLEQMFKELDLKPGNGASYVQEVPLVEITPFPGEKLQVKGKEKDYELNIGDDFVIYTQRLQEKVEINDSELVFCGFGIVAPEYDWNDYEGLDMKGKTAVVLVNDWG